MVNFNLNGNWVEFFNDDITSNQRISLIVPEELTYKFIKIKADNPNKRSSWEFAGWLSFLIIDDEITEIGNREGLTIGEKILEKPSILISYKLKIVAPYYFRRLKLSISGFNDRSAIYVNCGGNDYTDTLGRLWLADFGFTGGNIFRYSVLGIADPLPTADLINDPEIFKKERSATSFSYTFVVVNGTYTVRLYFAEVAFNQPNQRVFRVVINGVTVLNNFDIVPEVGRGQGLLKIFFSQVVTNGLMNIEFIAQTNNATITAIAIT